jgi:hypothetical protein
VDIKVRSGAAVAARKTLPTIKLTNIQRKFRMSLTPPAFGLALLFASGQAFAITPPYLRVEIYFNASRCTCQPSAKPRAKNSIAIFVGIPLLTVTFLLYMLYMAPKIIAAPCMKMDLD